MRQSLLFIFLGGSLIWVWTAMWSHPNARPEALPVVVVDPQKLELGEVWENDDFKLDVSFRNVTNLRQAATIIPSCSCMQVEPKILDLPPGIAVSAQFTLNLSKSFQSNRQTDAEFSEVVGLKLHDGSQGALRWPIRGTVKRAIRLSRNPIRFEDDYVRGSAPPATTLIVDSEVSLDEIRTSCDASFGHATVARSPDDNSRFLISLQLAPGLREGSFHFPLEVVPISNGAGLPSLSVEVTGRAVSDLKAVPSLVAFGAHAIGYSAKATLTLQSWGGWSFEVKEIAAEESTNVELAEQSSSMKIYKLTQQVRNEGHHSTQLRFEIQHEKFGAMSIVVVATYLGLPIGEEGP